jgi:hypothetical protein
MIFQANEIQKQARVTTLVPDKAYFKSKLFRRDKESHYILIKETIPQEDIAIKNIYAPNVGAPSS